MKEYLIELDVNGGEYTKYINVENVECVDVLDEFSVLIDDKIRIGFDERIQLRRILNKGEKIDE